MESTHGTVTSRPPVAANRVDVPAIVVVYLNQSAAASRGHENATRHELGRRLAAIKKLEFGGEFDHDKRYDTPLYYVPAETLCRSDLRDDLAIRNEHDLFGGVVPFPFVGSKVITHSLVEPDAAAPEGWNAGLGASMGDAVLPGYSIFSAGDARIAFERLRELGTVRLKKASGIGGLGQWVLKDQAHLDEILAGLAPEEISVHGLVLELNLASDVETHSVGQVRVGDLLATYCGTQQLVRNNHGQEVYGGSRLTVVRGDFDVLGKLPLAPEVRGVIRQADKYHASVMAAFPGLFASRCNYDVVTGKDASGTPHCGVLEQSWRAGGASGAEIAALEAFQQDPALQVVAASTSEVYGESVPTPSDAFIYFDGVDDHVGRLTKFARLEDYAHP